MADAGRIGVNQLATGAVAGTLADADLNNEEATWGIDEDVATSAIRPRLKDSAGTVTQSRFAVPLNAGAHGAFVDLAVDGTPAAGDEQSYSLNVDGTPFVEAYAEADGAGATQNEGVVFVGKNNAVPDAALDNEEWTAYLDEANSNLEFKVRDSAGNVLTGTVSLT